MAAQNRLMPAVTWEIFASRNAALNSFENGTNAGEDEESRIELPSFPSVKIHRQTICFEFEWEPWTRRYNELSPICARLLAETKSKQIIVDFQGNASNQKASSISMFCLSTLFRKVNDLNGRFALCGLTEEFQELFVEHVKMYRFIQTKEHSS